MNTIAIMPEEMKIAELDAEGAIQISAESDLEQFSGPQLAKIYNEFAESPIAHFTNKSIGMRRVWVMLQEKFNLSADPVETAVHSAFESASLPTTTAEQISEQISESEAKGEEQKAGEEQASPTLGALEKAGKDKPEVKAKKVRADSKTDKLRALLTNGKHHTIEDICNQTGFDAKNASITMSILKNPNKVKNSLVIARDNAGGYFVPNHEKASQ